MTTQTCQVYIQCSRPSCKKPLWSPYIDPTRPAEKDLELDIELDEKLFGSYNGSPKAEEKQHPGPLARLLSKKQSPSLSRHSIRVNKVSSSSAPRELCSFICNTCLINWAYAIPEMPEVELHRTSLII
jgi:hypothetical protein